MKCDEARPACNRCLDTGRKCDGYPHREDINPPVGYLVFYDHPPCPTEVPLAVRAFQFFCEVSGPSFVNFGSFTFWNDLAVRVSYFDQSIKKLIIAVGYLDQSSRLNPSADTKDATFYKYYGEALRLLSRAKNPDVGVMLTACLLLIVCDEFSHNAYAVVQHILAGRKILEDYYTSRKRLGYTNATVDEIGPIFARLSLHTGEFNNLTLPKSHRWPREGGENPEPSVYEGYPHLSSFQGYDSVEMAATCLQGLSEFCLLPTPGSLPPSSRFQTVKVTEQLNQWLVYFSDFTSRMDLQMAADQRARLHLLRAYHLCMMIMSRVIPFQDEMLFDKHSTIFEHVMVICGQVMSRTTEGLIAPLFFVATRYRSTASRYKAVEMLRRCGWEGFRLARIAEEVVSMEEHAIEEPIVCTDIPKENRIAVTSMTSHQSTGDCVLHFEKFDMARPRQVCLPCFNYGKVDRDEIMIQSVNQVCEILSILLLVHEY